MKYYKQALIIRILKAGLNSIYFDGAVLVEMRVLLVHPQDLRLVSEVRLLEDFLRELLAGTQGRRADAPADDEVEAERGREQHAGPLIPEEDAGELEPVEEEAEAEEGLEGGVGLVLVHHQDRVDRVPVLQSVLHEALPVLDPAAHLLGGGQSGLLEPARQHAQVSPRPHQPLEVVVVHCLEAPQLEKEAGEGEVEDEPAAEADEVRERASLLRVHQGEQAESEDAVRVHSEEAAFLLIDLLLVDHLEVPEVFERLHHVVDEVDVPLAPPQGHLHHHHCQHAQQEVVVECEDSVDEDEDRSVEGQLQYHEEDAGDQALVAREVILLGGFVYHEHLLSPKYEAISDQ